MDRDQWLVEAAAENGLNTAYRLGDANLDGVVDGQDFLAWNAAKFTSSLDWSGGNFNGDGVVDGADFLMWNTHRFQSTNLALPTVPEPDTWPVPMLVLAYGVWRGGILKRKRK